MKDFYGHSTGNANFNISKTGDANFCASTTGNAKQDPSPTGYAGNHALPTPNPGNPIFFRATGFPSGHGKIYKYGVFEVAAFFLKKEPMTCGKLQKLLYYAQAWSFALTDNGLFGEVFGAGANGPFSPLLAEKYKGLGRFDILPVPTGECVFSGEDSELLESVWVTYGDRTENSLDTLSCTEMPWIAARSYNTVISEDDMRQYYRLCHHRKTVPNTAG
jgi:uncharacterized phage-associated protein